MTNADRHTPWYKARPIEAHFSFSIAIYMTLIVLFFKIINANEFDCKGIPYIALYAIEFTGLVITFGFYTIAHSYDFTMCILYLHLRDL